VFATFILILSGSISLGRLDLLLLSGFAAFTAWTLASVAWSHPCRARSTPPRALSPISPSSQSACYSQCRKRAGTYSAAS